MDEQTKLIGYDVITSEDHKLGHVVGVVGGDVLVVEHGAIRKHRHGLPLTFCTVDEGTRAIRTTLSKAMIQDSPGLDDAEAADERPIREYYGLAGGYDTPPTQGYGEVNADDPALAADQLTRDVGLTPPEEERARIREGAGDVYGPPGRPIIPPDPHSTGEPR